MLSIFLAVGLPFVPRKHGPTWDADTMFRAIKAVQAGASIRQSARLHLMPYPTLRRYIALLRYVSCRHPFLPFLKPFFSGITYQENVKSLTIVVSDIYVHLL